MKKIVVSIVVILFALTSQAQVTAYGRYTEGKSSVDADINIYGEKKISKKINFTYFSLVEKSWAEGLLGVSYSPKDWISVGFSVGIEQNPALYRFSNSIWIGKGKNSLLVLTEKGEGKENYWYKVNACHKFSEKFSLSAMAWRFHGVGPMFKYTFPKWETSLFILPAYDFEPKAYRLIAGIAVKI